MPRYEFTSWNGSFAPKGTPRAVVSTLHDTVQKALANADVKDLYAAQLMTPQGSASPEGFGRFFRSDFERVGKLIQIAESGRSSWIRDRQPRITPIEPKFHC